MLRDACRKTEVGGGPSRCIADYLSRLAPRPLIHFPVSDVKVSLWVLLAVGIATGYLAVAARLLGEDARVPAPLESRVAAEVAGLSLEDGDVLRRAIAGSDAAERELTTSSLTQFFIAGLALAIAVGEIDVVLSSHDHALWSTPAYPGGAMQISCGCYAEYAGRLDLAVDVISGAITGFQSGDLSGLDLTTVTAGETIERCDAWLAEAAPPADQSSGSQ